MPFKDDQKASGSCAQHMENMDENRKKVLCFAQISVSYGSVRCDIVDDRILHVCKD
jgi:hypothetical protein